MLPSSDHFLSFDFNEFKKIDVSRNISSKTTLSIENNLTPSQLIINQNISIDDTNLLKNKINALKSLLQKGIRLIYSTQNTNSIEELKFLLGIEALDVTQTIVSEGFFHETSKTLVLSEDDVFGKKSKNQKGIARQRRTLIYSPSNYRLLKLVTMSFTKN